MKRFGQIIGVRQEHFERYKKHHSEVWPEVLDMIKKCNIRNYSIYLRELELGKYYLFSYLEYVGDDFEADMKKMAADSETQRWWKETDPCQQPLPDAAARGKIWSDAQEVFYLK